METTNKNTKDNMQKVAQKKVTKDEIEDNARAYYLEQAKELGIDVDSDISTVDLVNVLIQNLKQQQSEDSATVAIKKSLKAAQQYNDMKALVRIRITCLNPAKDNWTGEVFTVGNSVIPPITRFIPFTATDGIWHVERIFLDFLRNRKYQQMSERSRTGKQKHYGVDYTKNKLKPEFKIEELPPLTEQELEELASFQAANGSVQTD